MKPCKEKLPDGEPCPNQVDKGQEKCPYHLAKQVAEERKRLSIALTVWGVNAIIGKGVARFKRL